MRQRLESDIVGDISKWLRKVDKALRAAGHPGLFFYKVHGSPFQRAGIPDIVACVAGVFVAIEAKRPGEKPTENQMATLQEIFECGGKVVVAYGVDETRGVIERALRSRDIDLKLP